MIIGLILIAIGVIALAIKLGVIAGSVWGYLWPVILIIVGLSWLWGGVFRRGRRMGRWMWWGCPCCSPSEEEKHNQ